MHAEKDKGALSSLNNQIAQLDSDIESSSADKKSINNKLAILHTKLKSEIQRQESERLIRLDAALKVCSNILAMSEGTNTELTQNQSARFLGTCLLITPGQGGKLAELHNRLKPAYKAVLSVRLLDKLMSEKLVKHPYVLEHFQAHCRYDKDSPGYKAYLQSVILPIMLTALFQDIGLLHPAAEVILKGEDGGQDPFRVLEQEERKKLLRLNFDHSKDYLKEGLGCQKYIGNSRAERSEFDKIEKAQLQFRVALLKDALIPKIGIGDIIKIPQTYASIVLSTKRNYSRKDLPKAALLIEKMAEKGSVKKRAAEVFVGIVGYFPQGFGVTYIPTDLRGYEQDSYEYCIVTRLNPKRPDEPLCRAVTRGLSYISSGTTSVIKKENNLQYMEARKKLTVVKKERLIEIMQKLVFEFDPEDVTDLLPQYWEPYEYFGNKKNQNLWNKDN
jgi:hypothetical protein